MSELNEFSEKIARLEAELERHKRAREREMKARLRAEELLEVKSRELYQTLEDLKRAELNYRSIFENAIEGIYQTTPDGEYLRANNRLVKIRGYDSFEDLKTDLKDGPDQFYVEKERRKVFQKLLEENEYVSGFESQIRQKNGQVRWISENAHMVRDDDGQLLYYEGTIQDITTRREAQEALQISKEELEQANKQLKQTQTQMVHQEKMAGLGQLAAGIAHEINNPVGFLMSNLGTLNEYVNTFKKFFDCYDQLFDSIDAKNEIGMQRCIDQVNALKEAEDLDFVLNDIEHLVSESAEGAERVKDIVLGLRNFARLDEAEIKEMDIHEGIESTLNVIWNVVKYKADVIKSYGDLPRLVCYPAQLNQVFMNLLTNAAQAIDDKGTIHIRTFVRDEQIVVEIEDTGKGILPEYLDKLFDPFFTTKPVGKGTGLGLAISHGIIEKHKGRISVQSEVGKGTVFTVFLPLKGGVEDV